MTKHVVIFAILIVTSSSRMMSQTWAPVHGLVGTVRALYRSGPLQSSAVYAGGDFLTSQTGDSLHHIGSFNGIKWHSLGLGVDGPVYSITSWNNQIIVGGAFTHAGGISSPGVAAWNGTAWISMAGGLSGTVYALSGSADAPLYAAGSVFLKGVFRGVVQWDGLRWDTVYASTDNIVYSMISYGGEIYLGGEFGTIGNIQVNSIASWDGGSNCAPLQGATVDGVDGIVMSLCVYQNELMVGGIFDAAGGENAQNLAAWNGTSWSQVSTQGPDGIVECMYSSADTLLIGGAFSNVGTTPVNALAGWNGTSWFPLGLGVVGSPVLSIAGGGGDYYIGGTFTAAGGLPMNDIARYSYVSGYSTICAFSILNPEGSLSATLDQTAKNWQMTIYEDSIGSSTVVATGNYTLLAAAVMTPGTYIIAQADSSPSYFRLNGNKTWNDTVSILINTATIDTFIDAPPSISVSLPLVQGWNLLSNPAVLTSDSIGLHFASAASLPFQYVTGSGYRQVTDMNNGTGFWLKFDSAQTVTLFGHPVLTLQVSLKQGWNLIGTGSGAVYPDSIQQQPTNNLASPYYGYNGSYYLPDSLRPGNGYWIKAKQNGQLIIKVR